MDKDQENFLSYWFSGYTNGLGQMDESAQDTLLRACGVDARVDAYTYAELMEMPLFGSAHRIPLFSDVLALVGALGLTGRAAEAIVRVPDLYGDESVLDEARALAPSDAPVPSALSSNACAHSDIAAFEASTHPRACEPFSILAPFQSTERLTPAC